GVESGRHDLRPGPGNRPHRRCVPDGQFERHQAAARAGRGLVVFRPDRRSRVLVAEPDDADRPDRRRRHRSWGGTLGSHGRNGFVKNGVPGNLPPGVNPAGIDPVAAVDGDVSVSFSSATPAPASTIQLFAEHNYWGGGAPAISTTSGGAPATDIY